MIDRELVILIVLHVFVFGMAFLLAQFHEHKSLATFAEIALGTAL